MSKIGDKIHDLRTKRGLTLSELGKRIGLSTSAISMYERGERQPSFETAEVFADFFNVPLSAMIGEGETNSHNTINGSGNVIGNGNTILTLSAQENALLDLFRSLDVIGQAKVLAYAADQKKTGNNPDQL